MDDSTDTEEPEEKGQAEMSKDYAFLLKKTERLEDTTERLEALLGKTEARFKQKIEVLEASLLQQGGIQVKLNDAKLRAVENIVKSQIFKQYKFLPKAHDKDQTGNLAGAGEVAGAWEDRGGLEEQRYVKIEKTGLDFAVNTNWDVFRHPALSMLPAMMWPRMEWG